MPTTQQLRAQAKARKIKKYYSLNKAQLLQSLGLKDDLKSHKLSKGKGDAIAAQSQKLSKGNTTDRAKIKGRLKRAIARDLRSAGEGLTQEMKREIAIKAIRREAKQIKRGTKELRGGSVRKAGQEMTPAQRQRAKNLSEKSRAEKGMSERKKSRISVSASETMSVRDRREKMRRQFDPNSSGSRVETLARKEERRAVVAMGGEKVTREERLERGKDKAAIEKGAKVDRVKRSTLEKERAAIGLSLYGHPIPTSGPRFPAAERRRQQGDSRSALKAEIKTGKTRLELEEVKTASDRAAYSTQEAKAARAGGRTGDAKAWEKEAKNAQRVSLNKAIGKQKQQQTSLFGVTDHASDMPLFAAKKQAKPYPKRTKVSRRTAGKTALSIERGKAKAALPKPPKMPTLKGSEKQIEWASRIREVSLGKFDDFIADRAKTSGDKKEPLKKALNVLLHETAAGKTDAKWWIDNRAVGGKYGEKSYNMVDPFRVFSVAKEHKQDRFTELSDAFGLGPKPKRGKPKAAKTSANRIDDAPIQMAKKQTTQGRSVD